MEENNIKNDANADAAPKNVDTIAPTASDDQAPIASQVANNTPTAEQPTLEQTPPTEAPSPVAPSEPKSESGPSFPSSNPANQSSDFSIAPKTSSNRKKGSIIALAIVLLLGVAIAVYFAFF